MIYLPRPSATMMKRKGDRGSPYLIPLDGLKFLEGDPLSKIKKTSEEIREETQLIHIKSKPKALRILRR